MKKNNKHSCPLCGTPLAEYERYPWYVCPKCASKVTDINGRRLVFYNLDFSGDFSAKYNDTGEIYNSHTCYIECIECYADEARFGGIVVQKVILDVDDGSELCEA